MCSTSAGQTHPPNLSSYFGNSISLLPLGNGSTIQEWTVKLLALSFDPTIRHVTQTRSIKFFLLDFYITLSGKRRFLPTLFVGCSVISLDLCITIMSFSAWRNSKLKEWGCMVLEGHSLYFSAQNWVSCLGVGKGDRFYGEEDLITVTPTATYTKY